MYSSLLFHIATKAVFVQVTKESSVEILIISLSLSVEEFWLTLSLLETFPLIASKAQETMLPSLLSSLPLFFSSSAQFLTVENGLELNMASLLFSTCTFSLDDPFQTMAFIPSLPSWCSVLFLEPWPLPWAACLYITVVIAELGLFLLVGYY